jgi:hypothetical protein
VTAAEDVVVDEKVNQIRQHFLFRTAKDRDI